MKTQPLASPEEGPVVPDDVSVRPFRAADFSGVLEAFSASDTADTLTAEWFTSAVLLSEDFDSNGLLVATVHDQVVGAVYAVHTTRDLPGIDPDGGWIPLLFVTTEFRRQGVGGALLQRATAFLADRGAQWATIAAFAPGYLIPGVDVTNSPESVPFLVKRGFGEIESPVSMGMDLTTYRHDAATDALVTAAEADGFTFAACTPGDLPEVMTFAASVTGGDWGDVLRDSVVRHGAPERISIARDAENAVVGFATFGSYEGNEERFGPFGVDPAVRGRSLGKILLHHTLTSMKARGNANAWFLWTDLDSPAGHLYTQVGFRVLRQFAIMRSDFPPTPSHHKQPTRGVGHA